MNKLLLNCLLIVSTYSFAQGNFNSDCFIQDSKELKLELVKTTLKIPNYSSIDSSKKGELDSCLLKYVINSDDGSLMTLITVYDVSHYPDQIMEQVIDNEGQLVKQGMDFKKDFTLISDSSVTADKVKVGFIKDKLQDKQPKFYFLIIYYYLGKKQVHILLQETIKEGVSENKSLVDCIAKTLTFY